MKVNYTKNKIDKASENPLYRMCGERRENVYRALTRKLQFGPSGPSWESKCSKHTRVNAPKCSWGGLGSCSEPTPPHQARVLGGEAL